MKSSTASSASRRRPNKQRRPHPCPGDGGISGNRILLWSSTTRTTAPKITEGISRTLLASSF
ncbi:hypothetical protein LINGRAHAP2_LOCUS4392 [Linum grandiflorum]